MRDFASAELRHEIAARAARLIAEEGLDYAAAKRRAARELAGDARGGVRADRLPDNALVEEQVRAYQALFMADTQPARLSALRLTAVELMRWLGAFRPHLTGAVFNGTAGLHSDIHLQLFCDSAKDVEIFLVNAGIVFETSEAPRRGTHASEPVETLSFVWRQTQPRGQGAAGRSAEPEGVHLTILRVEDLRSPGRQCAADRADLISLEVLITRSSAIDG